MTISISKARSFQPGKSAPTRRSVLLGSAQRWLEANLTAANLTLNGPEPWDPQIHDPRTYHRIVRDGAIGIGESYMDGWWDCEQLDELVSRISSAQVDVNLFGRWQLAKMWMLARLMNLQTEKRAFMVGEQHYDVGNDLYQAMLDPTMSYSCGYWQDANNLDQAQQAKLDLICRKLKLQAGESVLDIGCGWGSFCEWAARHCGARATGITISREQQILAQQRCAELPVSIELMDYRKLQGQFDKIASIGMFEHVGHKNYDTYMRHAQRLLNDDGIFVLHTIGSDETLMGTDPWINKYIFPNGYLPSLSQICQSSEPYFVIEDVHNFGVDYDLTLMAWHQNFVYSWDQIKHQYDERFYRMWNYYLKGCAGAFRSRSLQLFQVVLRKRLQPMPRYQGVR